MSTKIFQTNDQTALGGVVWLESALFVLVFLGYGIENLEDLLLI